MSERGREHLTGGREAFPDVREWSADPSGCLGMVGRPPGFPGVVVRHSRMSGSGREALPDVWGWSGDHAGCPGVVMSPSQMSGSGR